MGFKWPDGMKEVFHLDRLEGNKAIFKDWNVQATFAVILFTVFLHNFPFIY
jgi:trimethylamine monooxygenase